MSSFIDKTHQVIQGSLSANVYKRTKSTPLRRRIVLQQMDWYQQCVLATNSSEPLCVHSEEEEKAKAKL